MSGIIEKIKSEMKKLANTEIAEHSQKFFKTGKGEYAEGDIFIGIRVPVIRQLAKKYREITLDEMETILQSPIHEQRMLALIFLVNRYQKGNDVEQKNIYNICLKNLGFINNWDLVDISIPHIVGAYLFDKDRKILFKMAKSKNLWQRRIAIMATFHFIRNNDFSHALTIAEMLLNDREDLLHKAAGWMLREVGNRNLAEEEVFLKRHYKSMPRTMLRYAIEKFPEDKRKKYLEGSI